VISDITVAANVEHLKIELREELQPSRIPSRHVRARLQVCKSCVICIDREGLIRE
jgi:hypothetical protein